MKRSVLIVAAVAVLASACSSGGSVAARVDGTAISVADVQSLFPASGTVDKTQFADELTNAIVDEILVEAAKSEYGISFTDQEIQAEHDKLKSQITASGTEYEAFLAQQGITDHLVERVAAQTLIQAAVIEKLAVNAAPITEDAVQQEYQADTTALTTACVKHILVATEDEAKAVKQRLLAGEDFATVAKDVSIDPSASQNGGDLGCASLSNYDMGFAAGVMAAPIGEPSDPVQSQFGWHIILVSSRDTPTLDTVHDQIVQKLTDDRNNQLYSDWVLKEAAAAKVEVEARYGTWTTDPSPQVTPPN